MVRYENRPSFISAGRINSSMEEDLPLQRVKIAGSTIASLLHRCSADPGDSDGLLFGRVSLISPSTLSDDHSSSSPGGVVTTVTGFCSAGTTSSFYDSAGNIELDKLRRSLHLSPSHHLLGWFSARRRSQLRPSLREFSVSYSLSSRSEFAFPVENSSSTFFPSIFLLITTPFQNHQTLIHTHDYCAYQFRASSGEFEARPLDIVNIGPDFRGHYSNFSPNSDFPHLSCNSTGSSMKGVGKGSDSLTYMKKVTVDQRQLEVYTEEDYKVFDLNRLVGFEAANYTSELENLYENMLAKLGSLAKLVESSSGKVIEQENYNAMLRDKVAGLEILE